LATVCNLRLTGPEIPAFRAFDFVSRLPISQSGSESAESLRPCPRKFPFCRDFRRRPVRSRLPPDHATLIVCDRENSSLSSGSRADGVKQSRLRPDRLHDVASNLV